MIEWIKRGPAALWPADPDYPEGRDVDLTRGQRGCTFDLPWPAEEEGLWLVSCDVCGRKAIASAGGVACDPRSIRLACRQN